MISAEQARKKLDEELAKEKAEREAVATSILVLIEPLILKTISEERKNNIHIIWSVLCTDPPTPYIINIIKSKLEELKYNTQSAPVEGKSSMYISW